MVYRLGDRAPPRRRTWPTRPARAFGAAREAPFTNRDAFMDAIETGGMAVMELIARELKAMGLYIARSLSFDGVESNRLRIR